ncbi:unnamed protein product [Rodentolepis nana]|uniref:FHA domain-containing protein n=1 Tax=Rodentolepis nana TaxID=102285 RepID=A0A0R3TL54_RODNA|nr:unnamed protein product [Rodentolepis nana]
MQRKGQPIMILTCQHDSHYFEERTIVVTDIIKVGRAVARSKAAPNNAIFDCKVLSRNHAVIWYSNEEFWLRDTNSSNGTFVNNTRVTKRDDSDHCDRQIFSGDVIRFGVDVVEHDTTHGCIIATVTLILPNGLEAKAKLGHPSDALTTGLVSINNEQMFQISCFINDAIFREEALDKKLDVLRKSLRQATLASELGWQAMLNQEKLLQKFDLYESQIRLFKEDLSENSLKLKLCDLLEEKSLQEEESKAQLTKLVKDKEVALQRIKDLERTIEGLQMECNHLRNEYSSAHDACTNISDEYKANLTTISQRLNDLSTERSQLNEQLQKANQENDVLKEQLERVTQDLAVTKEQYEKAQLKGSSSFINGLSYVDDVEKGMNEGINSIDMVIESCEPALAQSQPIDHVSSDEVDSSKSEANEYISDSIRDFHRALELIRLLDAKVSSLAITTDLDEKKFEDASNDNDSAVTNSNEISSLSTTSIDSIVKRIVHHNEAAMTSLHAYLRQVNPAAAAELINKIYLSNSGGEEALDSSTSSFEVKTYKRPDYLTLSNSRVCSETSSFSSEISAVPSSTGVTVVGADSLSASPTVSSGNGSLSCAMTPDSEEVAHLRESVRLANEEIEQYKAHIAELQKSVGTPPSESTQSTTSEQDLEEMHAECNVLRARLGDIEEQMAQTRENHRRLVEEARQHRDEVEKLRFQRSQLESALAEAQDQIEKLRFSSSSSSKNSYIHSNPPNHNASTFSYSSSSSNASSFVAESVHSDRLELAPSRLVTVRLQNSTIHSLSFIIELALSSSCFRLLLALRRFVINCNSTHDLGVRCNVCDLLKVRQLEGKNDCNDSNSPRHPIILPLQTRSRGL